MGQYKVEKQPVAVTLFFTDGVVREGMVYLDVESRERGSVHTLFALFRQPGSFFPFRGRDGHFQMINKSAVTHARHDEPESDERLYGDPQPVKIAFFGNETLSGTIRIAMPEGRNRLQDYLNDASGFMPMEGNAARYLVNADLIRDIAPQD